MLNADLPSIAQNGRGLYARLARYSCANKYQSAQITPQDSKSYQWTPAPFQAVFIQSQRELLLTCESGADSVLQMPSLDSEVMATVTLDSKACRIVDSDLQINGEIGALLSGLENTQQIARDWAQMQLSRLCALQR